MKTLTKLPTSVATLVGAALFACTCARAETINQTVTQGLGANWNTSLSWGTPAAAPVSTNDYVTPAGFDVRTPDSQTPSTFIGQSLQIESGGRLILKNGGADAGLATVNLILNGGSITYNTASGTTISALGGPLQVLASSTVNSVAGTSNTRDIWLRSTLSGSGNLNVGMVNRAVVLLGTNTGYSGNWTVNTGRIEIGNNATDALGSGSVDLIGLDNALVFNATNDFTINNGISGIGSVVQRNTNTVTFGGSNPFFFGTVRVESGVLKVQTAAALSEASVLTLAGGTLDATPLGGLTLNASSSFQTLNCQGTIVAGLTASSGNTLNFNLTPTTNDILNVTGPLTLNGNPTLNLASSGFKPAGTYRLINYSGTIQGGGSFFLNPPVGSSQIFTLDTSTPGQVDLVISGLPQDLTWVGDGFANTWDTFSANWTGDASIYSEGDNVTFNDSGSASPNINVFADVAPSSMTVNNSSQAYTFEGAGILCAGSLVKQGSNELIFASSSNGFTGPVTIEAGTLSLGGGGASGALGTPSAITNNGILQVNRSAGGPGILCPISGSGAIVVTGGGGVLELFGTNSYTGPTTIGDACQLNIATESALGTTDAGTTVQANGRLGVNTFVGSLTVPEPIVVNGLGVSLAPGALYLNTPGNDLTYSGPVTIGSDARFRVINVDTRMTFANSVSGTDVNLWCSAVDGGATPSTIRFESALALGTGSLTKDGSGLLILGSANHTCGGTTVSNGTLLVNGVLNGGTVTVLDSGTLGGLGTNQGPVVVQAGATLAPGESIGTFTVNDTVALGGIALMEINPTNAQNADLLAATSVQLGGILTVVNTGPEPQVGDVFNLFEGTLAGTFTGTNLPAFAAPGLIWDTSLLASQGTISVTTNSLPLLPLEITDIAAQPGGVTLTWNSYPGQFYTAEYSLDLGVWDLALTDIPGDAVTNSTTQVLDLTGSGGANGVILAKYDMTSFNAVIQDAGSLVTAGSLTKGSGVNSFTAPSSQGYPTDPVLFCNAVTTGTTLEAAVANQTWFTFELTVGTNVTDLDLTGLTFNGARGGGATPRGYGVYVTTPTTTDELVQGATAFATQRPVWSPQSINLGGITSLQNLTNGQVVTFKIPFFAPAAGNSVEFDDFTVIGNVSPAPGPQPPYVGAGQLFFRIKEQ